MILIMKVKKLCGKLIEKDICIAKEIDEMKLQSRQDKMKHFSSLKFYAKEEKKPPFTATQLSL